MADTNFNFDLSNFNKGIDEIQKRIQQMAAALKVATDPKVVNNLTNSIKEATSELDKLKSSIAGVGSAINTIPNIGNAISSAMDLATTSMNAMVGSSANLVANLQQAQGFATKPFVNQQINTQTTTTTTTNRPTGPGAVQFGAGGDSGNIDRTARSFDNLTQSIREATRESSVLQQAAVDLSKIDWSTLRFAVPENLRGQYAEISKQLNIFKHEALDLASAIEIIKGEGPIISPENIKITQQLEAEFERVNKEVSKYSDLKHKIETSVGGSGKSRFANELFSVQQILREMPAFTYSAQTGILALSNNIPILIDDFKKMRTSIDSVTGETMGWKKATGMMIKEIFTFTGIATIAISVLTIWGPKLWELITGTKELTEAEKALAKETETIKQKYSDANAEIEKFVSLLDKGVISLDNQYSSLVQLEKIVGVDLTSAYSKLGNSIKDATDLQSLLIIEMEKAQDLEINMAKRKSYRLEKIKADEEVNKLLKESNKETAKAVETLKGIPEKWIAPLQSGEMPIKLVKQGKLKMEDLEQFQVYVKAYDKIITSQKAFTLTGDKIVDNLIKSLEAGKKYNDEIKVSNKLNSEGNLTLLERVKLTKDNFEMNVMNAEAMAMDKSGKGTLTSEKQTAIRKEALKTQLKELAIISKDFENDIKKRNSELDKEIAKATTTSQKNQLKEKKIAINGEGKWLLTEQKKIQAELNKVDGKAIDKANKAKVDATKVYVAKEADIEKQLTEDYTNILKLRLQLTKDSYEKEANIITEKYNELDIKAKQRHIDEIKILEDAFNTRVDFQRKEADIKEAAGKIKDPKKAQEYTDKGLAELKAYKKKEFEIFKETDSQSVRSSQFLTKTIYLNNKNLYDELLKLASKYALDREAFNRVFDKKLALRNIISNDATLKIQKQQLENLYSELEQIKEKRAFTLFEQPKETSVFVAWKEEAFKFTQQDVPKIKEDLDLLLKNNPADRMVGVYQLAIENLKGKTVDLYDIFKETSDRMSVLSAQKAKDLEGITDPGEISKIEDKYKDLTKLAEYYIESLKVVNENNKNLFVLGEDVDKANALLAKQVALTEELAKAQTNLDNASEAEIYDASKIVTALQTQKDIVTKELDALKLKPISPTNIDKEAFKLAIKKFNEDLQKDPNATINIVPSSDIILGRFRKTLDDAKAALEGGDMTKFNELLSQAFNVGESIQKGLTPEEKKALKDSFDTIYKEAEAVLAENLDKKKGEIVSESAKKSGYNTEGVPKQFKRKEMWKQDNVDMDIKKAELESSRELLQMRISANLATEAEIIAFHKREMELIQEQKSKLAKQIKDISDSIGGIFQTTFDAISTMAQNSMSLENERMATQQAISDNLIAGYDREISKIKEMTETQIMSASERVNAEQKILDFERLKEQEAKNQKIRQLELQKKQIETNKKLALAQAAISGGVALANVVAIATEGAVGTGPAAPFVFAAELAAGLGAVGASIMSAKQAINSSDAQITTIDEQIAGIEASYQAGLNKGAGVTSESSSKTGPSAPLTTFNADLVNQGQSSANYNVNDTLGGYKIYVTQADIQNANNQASKIKKKVTFG